MRIYMFKKFINFIFLITINTFLIYHSYAIHFNELSESQIENIVKRSYKVIPFSGQYAMNLGVHIEGLSNGKEEIS